MGEKLRGRFIGRYPLWRALCDYVGKFTGLGASTDPSVAEREERGIKGGECPTILKFSCPKIRTYMRLKVFIRLWKVEPLKEFNTTSQSSFKFPGPLSGPGQREVWGVCVGAVRAYPLFLPFPDNAQALKIACWGEVECEKGLRELP